MTASLLRARPYRFSTQVATVDSPSGHKDPYGASSVPIYQTATFKGMDGQYDYTRSGNPTRTHLGKWSDLRRGLDWAGGRASERDREGRRR